MASLGAKLRNRPQAAFRDHRNPEPRETIYLTPGCTEKHLHHELAHVYGATTEEEAQWAEVYR